MRLHEERSTRYSSSPPAAVGYLVLSQTQRNDISQPRLFLLAVEPKAKSDAEEF